MVSNCFHGNMFVSSNTNGSLFLHFYDPITNIVSSKSLYYSPTIGFANSAVYSGEILVTGHETGFIIIWNATGNIFQPIRTVNSSSPNPIP
ncbi:unnamed protein product, partial [Rotaria sp. Silwood1]